MEDIESSPPAASPNSRKRSAPDESPAKRPLNLKGTQFVMPTPPDTDHSSNVSISANNEDNSRHGSPAPSSSALSSVEVVDDAINADHTDAAAPTTQAEASAKSGQPPTKRRKLTPTEKQQNQQEKEAKAAEKAELKAQKEEEKRTKEEEKRKKAEERGEKKRIKDEEKRKITEEREAKKREKELEEERKAQEKLKKERSQMRLGVFFQKPATPVKQDESGAPIQGSARRKSLSLEPFDNVAEEIRRSQSPMKGGSSASKTQQQANVPPSPLTTSKSALTDYHKYFLPYQLPRNSTLPADFIVEIEEEDQISFDHQLDDPSIREKYDLGLVDSYASLERQFANERKAIRGLPTAPVKSLIEQIHGSFQQPIDLTSDQTPINPVDDFQNISLRYLEFSEDVRPAYFGTYSKAFSPQTTRKLSRNPYTRARKDTDYDYDSEAEWEEPEEGEDLEDEDDDEADSQCDAHEMDEFLDDEEDTLKNKRKQITGDLVPSCTGLCWETSSGKIIPSIEDASPSKALKGMRMGYLLPGFTGGSIDPFSTAYWQNDPLKDSKPTPVAQPSIDQANGLLAPPRPPLQPRASGNGTLNHMLVGAAKGEKGPITSVGSTQGEKRGRKPAPKTLSTEDMEEFKEAVVNSPLSKADLLKGLKARFPKMTNEVIKSTLGEHFAQMGASKAEKKWIFVSAS